MKRYGKAVARGIVHRMSNDGFRDVGQVTEFFQICGERLLHSASEWQSWFSIPFIKAPEHDPAFSIYFTKEWKETFLVSLNNFLSQVFQVSKTSFCEKFGWTRGFLEKMSQFSVLKQNLKLPTVLRFNLERQNRKSIEMEVEFLKSERTRLLTINEIREAEIRKLRNSLYSKNLGHQSVDELPLQVLVDLITKVSQFVRPRPGQFLKTLCLCQALCQVSVRKKSQRDLQGEQQAEASDSNIYEEQVNIGSLPSTCSPPHLNQNAAIPGPDFDQSVAQTNDDNLKETQADENGASSEEENSSELTISVARVKA